MDDPTTLIASLAEASRRGRLQFITNDALNQFQTNVSLTDIDFASPVFVIGSLLHVSSDLVSKLDTSGRNEASRVLEAARIKVGQKKLMLPYSSAFFIVEPAPIDVLAPGHKPFQAVVVYAVQQPGTNKIALTSVRQYKSEKLGADIWSMYPAFAVLDERFATDETSAYFREGVKLTPAYQQRILSELETELKTISICIELINTPHTVKQLPVAPSAYAMQVNAGRARGKLKPLGEVIKLELNAERNAAATGRTIASAPKQPHDRRGHWATSKKGKQFWRRNMAIKGGRTKGAIYNVE